MANNTIFFENPTSGQKKKAPVGISWTTLFFGPFPALMRGSFKWFAIILLTSIFTMGISHFVFMFLFNKLYIKDLIGAGYKAKSVEEGTVEQMSSTLGVPVLLQLSEPSRSSLLPIHLKFILLLRPT